MFIPFARMLALQAAIAPRTRHNNATRIGHNVEDTLLPLLSVVLGSIPSFVESTRLSVPNNNQHMQPNPVQPLKSKDSRQAPIPPRKDFGRPEEYIAHSHLVSALDTFPYGVGSRCPCSSPYSPLFYQGAPLAKLWLADGWGRRRRTNSASRCFRHRESGRGSGVCLQRRRMQRL